MVEKKQLNIGSCPIFRTITSVKYRYFWCRQIFLIQSLYNFFFILGIFYKIGSSINFENNPFKVQVIYENILS